MSISRLIKKKKWFIYTTEIHSATKKKVLTSFSGKLSELELTIRREMSQTQKDSCQASIPSIIESSYHIDAQNHLHIIFLSSPSMLPYLMLSLIFRLVPSSSQNDCTAPDAVVTRLSGRGDAYLLTFCLYYSEMYTYVNEGRIVRRPPYFLITQL